MSWHSRAGKVEAPSVVLTLAVKQLAAVWENGEDALSQYTELQSVVASL